MVDKPRHGFVLNVAPWLCRFGRAGTAIENEMPPLRWISYLGLINILMVILLVPAALGQEKNIEINERQIKAAEIRGHDGEHIDFCRVSDYTVKGQTIDFINLQCKNKNLGIDPAHYRLVLAGELVTFEIPWTGAQIKALLALN